MPERGMIIQPIDDIRQHQVCITTSEYIAKASDIYGLKIETIPVYFDLKGRAAGMYRTQRGIRSIRYNPYIFAKYFNNNLATTVPHEVAHYITDLLYGLRTIKPHGPEWRQVMQALGAEATVTSIYDLTGVPVRRHKSYSYRCDCTTHKLGAVRHNKILNKQASYYCRHCSSAIKPDTADDNIQKI